MKDTKPLSPGDFDITPVHKQADSLHALQQSNGSSLKSLENSGPSDEQLALPRKKPRLSAIDPLLVATLAQPYIQANASSKPAGLSSNSHSSLPHINSNYPITGATSKLQQPKVSSPRFVEPFGRSHDQLAPPHKKPRISTTALVAALDQPRLKSKASLPSSIRSSDD